MKAKKYLNWRTWLKSNDTGFVAASVILDTWDKRFNVGKKLTKPVLEKTVEATFTLCRNGWEKPVTLDWYSDNKKDAAANLKQMKTILYHIEGLIDTYESAIKDAKQV